THSLPKLGWLEYLSGDTKNAVETLRDAADHGSGTSKALSLYYRGAMLSRTGNDAEAITALDKAITERPDLAKAYEEKGEALWRSDNKEAAVAAWKDAVRVNPNLPLANYMLASASEEAGRESDAAGFKLQADRATPNDPYFHWMVGLRLKNAGMADAAASHFQKAIALNPAFALRMNSIRK